MGKYGHTNTRPPEPAKYGTEFSTTDRFGPNNSPPPVSPSVEVQIQSPPGMAKGSGTVKKGWSAANFLELAGAIIVLSLVAHADTNSGGKGLLDPSVLFLLWVVFFTFLIREW